MTAEEKMKNPRYCNGKMKKGQFVCLHVCIVILLFFGVILPVLYYLVIPSFIQSTISNIGKTERKGGYTRISKAAIPSVSDNHLAFGVKVAMAPMIPFPVRVGLKPFEIKLFQKKSGGDVELGSMSLDSEIDLWLNKELQISMDGKIKLTTENQANSKAVISQAAQSTKDLVLQARFAPSIQLFGFTLYSSLPLYRDITFEEAPEKKQVVTGNCFLI
jgi:hypothetical protein